MVLACHRKVTMGVWATCLLAVMLAGCSTVSSMISPNRGATDASGNAVGTLIPNKSMQLGRTTALSAENLVLGTVLYWVVDPLAPNWQLQQVPLGPDRLRISLRKKQFTTGGDGEAVQVFFRQAEQVRRDGGYASYTVMEYTEGIESTIPVAQRVSQGVIQLNR